jgi:cellulose synthase/poly-beta-1,6-N-acetylglucosamine synthase-like glycosyltransferase
MSKIDVFMPAHNEEILIGETIASVHAQEISGKNTYTVTVIANGCTDATADTARQVIESLPVRDNLNFQVIELEKASKAHALNHALGQSNTDFFMYIDADVTFSPDCFEKVMESFDDPKVMLSGAEPHIKIPEQIAGTHLEGIFQVRDIVNRTPGRFLMPIGRMITFRKQVASQFSETVASEDNWITYRVVESNGWDAIKVVKGAEVYDVAPDNWADFLLQESRARATSIQLVKACPELAPLKEEGERLQRERNPPEKTREAALAQMAMQGLAPELFDEFSVTLEKIFQENSRLQQGLIRDDGTWKPVGSTKRR